MKKQKDKKIAIIGSGAMGTAMAKVLTDSGYWNITIYGVEESELKDLEKGINTKYFPNSIKLPKFRTTMITSEAVGEAEYILLAVPSKFMDVVFADVLGSLSKPTLIINLAKGFYPGTMSSLHGGLINASKNHKFVRGVVSLIGPSHAEEIVRCMPTIVSSVDKDKKLAAEVQELFSNEYFRVYVQTDVKGAETGAAYKNILAISSGIATGLGYGVNTIAALLTRGMAEMARFNKAMKGKRETIYGLTGLGDLIVTATSDLSRNFTFGKNFATQGVKALETNATVEGLEALKFVYTIGKEKGLELPIVEMLYQTIAKRKDPKDAVAEFWSRGTKAE